MNPYYQVIVLGSAFSMLTAVIAIQGNIFLPRRPRNHFQYFFLLLTLLNVSEYLAAYLQLTGGPSCLFHLFKSIELGMSPLVPLAAVGAIGGKKRLKIGIAIFFLNALLMLISRFTGWVYYLDAAGVYHRGVLYPVNIFFYMLALGILTWDCRLFCKKYQSESRIFLACIIILVLAGICLSFFGGSKLRLDWTFVSLAALLLYIFFNQLFLQTDDLTKLLNRTSYDSTTPRLKRPAVILMLDVNKFKTINDRYGHIYGDSCLERTGAHILEVFGPHGQCFRIGGDEFCVVLTSRFEDVDLLISQFHLLTRAQQESDHNFPGCSIGYAHFDPAKEDISTAFHRADLAMYADKQNRA